MMTTRQHWKLLNVHAQLQDVLSAASKQRDQRRELEATATGPEPGWVVYERRLMLAHVNKIRRDNGLARVYLDEIVSLDNLASGHCDWIEKFSFYCAEVAFDLHRLARR